MGHRFIWVHIHLLCVLLGLALFLQNGVIFSPKNYTCLLKTKIKYEAYTKIPLSFKTLPKYKIIYKYKIMPLSKVLLENIIVLI